MTTTSGKTGQTKENRNPEYLDKLRREGFVFHDEVCECFVSLVGGPADRRWKARVSTREADRRGKVFAFVRLQKQDFDAAKDYVVQRGSSFKIASTDDRPGYEMFDEKVASSPPHRFDEKSGGDWYGYSFAGMLLKLGNGLSDGQTTWSQAGEQAFLFWPAEDSAGAGVRLAASGKSTAPATVGSPLEDPSGSTRPVVDVPIRSDKDSSHSTLLRDVRRRIARTLRLPPGSSSRNVVFEGVPGTGKTDQLRRLRAELKALENNDLTVPLGEGRFAMTMHPATAYEDFVEGLRPASEQTRDEGAADKGPSRPVTGYIAKPMVKVAEPDMRGAEGPVTGRVGERWFWDEPPPGTSFRVVDGFFVAACAEAARHPWHTFVVLLDELNRCNVPKVMGDLLTTLESSRRARWQHEKGTPLESGCWDVSDAQVVSLPHSKRLFFVPDNLFVVGTMNTTDRSVAPLDAALRRRFAFVRVWPIGYPTTAASSSRNLLSELANRAKRARDAEIDKEVQKILEQSVDAWRAVNSKLETHGPDAMLGHSYLFDLAWDLAFAMDTEDRLHAVEHHWNRHILPQLADVLVTNDLIDEVFGNETDGILDASRLGWSSAQKNETAIEVGTTTLVFRAHAAGRGLLRHPSIRLERRPQPALAGQADAPPAPAVSPSAQTEPAKDDGLQG